MPERTVAEVIAACYEEPHIPRQRRRPPRSRTPLSPEEWRIVAAALLPPDRLRESYRRQR